MFNVEGEAGPYVITEADDVSSPAPENIQGPDEATAGRCIPETRTGAHGTQPSSQEGARNWNLLD